MNASYINQVTAASGTTHGRPLTGVVSVEDVRRGIGAAKAAGRAFCTNLFLRDAEFDKAVQAGSLRKLESDGALVLLKRESRFDRVYYAAADCDTLGAAVAGLPLQGDGVLVADVIGTKDEVSAVSGVFEAAGFFRRALLHRIQRVVSESAIVTERFPAVEVARMEDAPELLQGIVDNFDVYSDQIPSLEQILEAIARGTILLLRGSGRIGGFYYYERSGFTALGKCWLVLPGFRDRSLQLVSQYFQDCAGCRRLVGWVNEENHVSFRVHRLLGYRTDSILRMALMKKG